MDNIIRCKSCSRCLIAEEIENHHCSKVIDSRVDFVHGILYVYDGIGWYPVKLTARRSGDDLTGRKGDNNLKEPRFGLCKVVVGFSKCQKSSVMN